MSPNPRSQNTFHDLPTLDATTNDTMSTGCHLVVNSLLRGSCKQVCNCGMWNGELLGYQCEACMLSTPCIWSVAAIVEDGCGDLAQLVEHAWDIEGTRRSIGGPGIRPVRRPKGADFGDPEVVCLLKYLFRRSRSCNRARHSRAFTAV